LIFILEKILGIRRNEREIESVFFSMKNVRSKNHDQADTSELDIAMNAAAPEGTPRGGSITKSLSNIFLPRRASEKP
jgi:hypothetical protein